MQIPVNVFTGYLGSGKTTIILNLLKNIPKGYKVAVLKNEFGNKKIDSQLYKYENIEVMEMVNGCLCCVLVGKLNNAIHDIVNSYKPDRLIIETSGTAYPAPIVLELEKCKNILNLDSVVTVIDSLNFNGYTDTSYSAKMQAQYCDLILINKSELVNEIELEKVLDGVYELNSETPKVKTLKGHVSPDIVFGIEKYIILNDLKNIKINTLHHHDDVQIIDVDTDRNIPKKDFDTFLKDLPKWDFYRIKGIYNGKFLNYVFGKYNFSKISGLKDKGLRISLFGKNFSYHRKRIMEKLKLEEKEIVLLD